MLRSASGSIELVGVFEPPAEEYSPYGGPLIVSEAETTLATKLESARSACPEASTELLHGPTVARLLEHLTESDATLVAVGATGRNRSVGIVRGSITTAMLHLAPCSVLVARPGSGASPRSVAVGYDGSAAAASAVAAAGRVASRFGIPLRVISVGDVAPLDAETLTNAAVVFEPYDGSAVDALLEVSAGTDLLVVGSRGLRGLRALGSVSERVGHRASCSVLVTRDGS